MAEVKRYYWIKLKENFFDLETIDWLISQKNGCEYIVLYQKLCLMTANKDGNLSMQVGEMIIPYDCNKIARDTKFSIDTVIVAMELFKKIGLIYEQDNGVLKIPYVSELVGSETSSAKRMRKSRERKKLQCNKNVTQLPSQCDTDVTQEIEKENREKRIDIRDLEGEEEKGENAPDYTDPDNQLNLWKTHVLLTENQSADLLEKMGLEMFDEYLFRLNQYIDETGYKIKSHYETMLKWYNEDRAVS